MSVINQMLRELDARGNVPADMPLASDRPVDFKHYPAWLALGGVGLAAVAVATFSWMWPAMFTVTVPQEPPAIAPQQAQTVSSPSAAPATSSQSAPRLAAVVTRNSPVAPPQGRGRGVASDATQAPTEQPPPDAAALAAALTLQDAGTRQVEPAVIKNITLSPEDEAQQHYDDARMLHHAGKPEAAIGKHRQALARNSGMTAARIQLARLLQEKGQMDDALTLLQTGYAQRADDGLAIAAGRLLADQGQWEAALGWLQRGQSGLRPADHALMGALLSQAHRHEEAGLAYQRALAADPGQGGWRLGLGLALEAQGRLEEARTAYRNALEHGRFKPEVVQFLHERTDFPGH